MSNITINSLPTASTIDASLDILPIYTASSVATQGISRNTLLGLSSQPVGISDSQTLTNKILTSPTISGPTLSGTITGTYTIGGTPTFPSSVATLTGSQTLTNKVLTSPTINSPTITNATISTDAITGFSSSSTGTIYGISVTTGQISSALAMTSTATVSGLLTANSGFTLSSGSLTLPSTSINQSALPLGAVVQVVNTVTTASATGTTQIPFDDTIPQITEGDQYMTLAITPKSTTNILVIEALVWLSSSSASRNLSAALFQDTTANALAAASQFTDTTATLIPRMVPLTHTMTAGTTSATTFKIRAGANNTGTTTFNGTNGARNFGGISLSSIVITEYKA